MTLLYINIDIWLSRESCFRLMISSCVRLIVYAWPDLRHCLVHWAVPFGHLLFLVAEVDFIVIPADFLLS